METAARRISPLTRSCQYTETFNRIMEVVMIARSAIPNTDPMIDPLRKDPRFAELLHALGSSQWLPAEAIGRTAAQGL